MTYAHALFAEAVAQLRRPGTATYRFQLGPSRGFEHVAALSEYLDTLGVTDVYLSPCFKCGPGSTHGYDVTDHNAFNPEIGKPDHVRPHDRDAATSAGMGVILDIVPNHMGVAGDTNPWWMDVLENGPGSPCAAFFDIDWAPPKAELRNKVLLPVLPDQYGQVLEAATAPARADRRRVPSALRRAPGCPYAPSRTPGSSPIASRTWRHASGKTMSTSGELQEHPHCARPICPTGATRIRRASTSALREKDVVKRRLAALVKESAEIRDFVDDNLRAFNGRPGEAASFDLLDSPAVSAQTYRLADWRVAGDEVNYRRFFDINHLAAIRDGASGGLRRRATSCVFRLVGEGKVDGHAGGSPGRALRRPAEYFRRLQEGAILATARRLHARSATPRPALAVAAERRAPVAAESGERDARGRSGSPRRRSSSRRRATPRVVAGGGHDGLRLPRLGERPLRRSQHLAPADRAAYSRFAGNTRAHGGAELRRQAAHHAGLHGERDQRSSALRSIASRSATASRATSRSRASSARSGRSSRPLPSTAPTSATSGTSRARRDRAVHRPRARRGQAPEPHHERLDLRLPRATSCSCAIRLDSDESDARRAPSLRDALPADDGAGHRQGGGGHGVLSLPPARLAE